MSTTTANRARVSATNTMPPEHRAQELVIERNGVQYRRSVNLTLDMTQIPPEIIPGGMVYQWNRIGTYNQMDIQNQVTNERVGWRPVPADRHDGMFMPLGYKGDIVNGGLRLEERPIEWEQMAQAEQRRKALAQLGESQKQFGIQPTDPEAFSVKHPQARQATFATREIESGADIPRFDVSSQIPIDD